MLLAWIQILGSWIGALPLHHPSSCITSYHFVSHPRSLYRHQIIEVLKSKVEWLPLETMQRLISAYDSQRSGLIRFIRISVSLLCCVKPAMHNLISLIQKGTAACLVPIWLYFIYGYLWLTVQKKKDAKKNGYRPEAELDVMDSSVKSTDSSQSTDGLLFLLRLIHGLYEDCEGGVEMWVMR